MKKRWSDKFKVEALIKYYEGFQWREDTSFDNSQNYVLNLFFSSIETKVPSLLFQNPIFHISPKPKSVALDPESAFKDAQDRSDVLNDWAMDEDNHLGDVLESSIYDAFAAFGIVELGYSADWIENPWVKKPAYVKDFDVIDGNTVIRGTDVLPRNEKLYVKHISQSHFFVSAPDRPFLEQNDWCGYFEYVRVVDLKNDKNLKNTDELQGGFIAESDVDRERFQNGDFDKVWTIYDLREKKKIIWSESSDRVLLKKKFKTLPIIDLRFKRRMYGGWYPLPVTFNWVSPQNEANEVREANKLHRRRFKRMYQVKPGAVTPDEKEKFFAGPDGTLVETNSQIEPIANADLGSSAQQALIVSKDDFNIISGTSSEQRGSSDRTTATQAAITDNRSQIRESRERIVVANFLKRIGRVAIELIKDNFVNPLYVSQQSQQQDFLSNVQENTEPKVINPITDFSDNLEYNVNVEVDTMSPIANDAEKKKFIEFLSLLSQFPQFSLSPILVRELAYRTGYRNEKVIGEFQKMAQIQMVGMMQKQQEQLTPGNMGNNTVKQMQPGTSEQVRNQLQGQGVPVNS